MKIGVIADIHSNYRAFKACVDYMEKEKVDAYALLGDYIGELPCPQQTLNLVHSLERSKPCFIIRGNKEDYVLKGIGAPKPEWDEYKSILGMLRYGYSEIDEKEKEFFSTLPISATISYPGFPKISVCHGSPRSNVEKILPGSYDAEYLKTVEEDYIICAHTHTRFAMEVCGKTIWNPGSVGLPFHGSYKAECMVLHSSKHGWMGQFVSIPYDVDAEISEMYDEGLFEKAPYWSYMTEYILQGGKISHSRILRKAMEICEKEEGKCIWPCIPECYMRRAVFELGAISVRQANR